MNAFPNNFFCKLIFIFSLLLSGCAGAIAPKPYSDGPIDFRYEIQGESFFLSQLHGNPLVLVLVRTSEVTNEMHLDELQKIFPKIKDHVTILVLSIAQNEAPMLEMFTEFHSYPFNIGLAGPAVTTGHSAIGIIPSIPTTYLIDAKGNVVTLLQGAMNAQRITAALQSNNFIP